LRSPILLITSAALFGCPNNSSETCGPGSNAAADFSAGGSGIAATYGQLASHENHDCVAPNTPAGVVALTIDGVELGGAGLVTLCIPRPDLLATQTMDLANTSSTGSDVQIVDLTGSASGGCTFALDDTADVIGTISATGLCGEGSAGYELTFAAVVPVDVACGSGSATPASVNASATGVAVASSGS
jgi:hypothetical protein